MISRRDFLIAASALALQGCESTLSLPFFPKKRRPRYVISTECTYWGFRQNFSDIRIDKQLSLPDGTNSEIAEKFSLLTIANDNGSEVRRIAVPYMYHGAAACPRTGLIYLMGNYQPSALLALEPDSLKIVAFDRIPGSEAVTFGGHGVWIPGTDLMAFTMNGGKAGKFDYISLRDAVSLKERGRFSTFGFDVHEIRLSPDQKSFVCGHYGSYLGRGPYKGLSIYDLKRSSTDQNGEHVNLKYSSPEIIYPASVTFVDIQSGRRKGIFSDVTGGQEGHALSDDLANVYLPNSPSLLRCRKDAESNPRLIREGVVSTPDSGEFRNSGTVLGISVEFDAKFREVLVPNRNLNSILVTNVDSKILREMDYNAQLAGAGISWIKLMPGHNGGIALHPDGKHYVMSTRDGIIAMERGTHRLNPAMSFSMPLKTHSHMITI